MTGIRNALLSFSSDLIPSPLSWVSSNVVNRFDTQLAPLAPLKYISAKRQGITYFCLRHWKRQVRAAAYLIEGVGASSYKQTTNLICPTPITRRSTRWAVNVSTSILGAPKYDLVLGEIYNPLAHNLVDAPYLHPRILLDANFWYRASTRWVDGVVYIRQRCLPKNVSANVFCLLLRVCCKNLSRRSKVLHTLELHGGHCGYHVPSNWVSSSSNTHPREASTV